LVETERQTTVEAEMFRVSCRSDGDFLLRNIFLP
jgi:hypothetical protein